VHADLPLARLERQRPLAPLFGAQGTMRLDFSNTMLRRVVSALAWLLGEARRTIFTFAYKGQFAIA